MSSIAFTGVYAYRVAEEARQLANALAATELVLQREQHLSALDGLAAAAAHELGTPLATLAVILGDWKHMQPFTDDPELLHEIEEMQNQLLRCKAIVSNTLLSAGEARGGTTGATATTRRTRTTG